MGSFRGSTCGVSRRARLSPHAPCTPAAAPAFWWGVWGVADFGGKFEGFWGYNPV